MVFTALTVVWLLGSSAGLIQRESVADRLERECREIAAKIEPDAGRYRLERFIRYCIQKRAGID